MAEAGVLEMVLLDSVLDFEPPCEGGNGQCTAEVRWFGTPSCCREVTFRCTSHKEYIDRIFERGEMPRHTGGCGRRVDSMDWKQR